MRDFDVCVIGGGPSGFAAAMRCWDFGKKICLIEKSRIGGAGVHNGALSSKTMWELSRDYRKALKRDRGYIAQDIQVDCAQVMATVRQATSEKLEQLEQQLRALDRPQPECPGQIERISGVARFEDPHRVVVENMDGSSIRIITAEHFIIATGSRPRTLPTIEVDGEAIMTSDHVGDMTEFPRSIVILGAGVVGCEFATILANFGKTKVYMVDRAERILPFEDVDVARMVQTKLEQKGVTVHHQSKLISMERAGDQVQYTIEHATGGRETITVDRALISIGRIPNTDRLGLDKAGVELSERGYIVDNDTRTSAPHIFAAGDVTYDVALVNVGEIEGRRAAERISGQESRPLSYANLSTIMFLDPEVAAIGLNEQQAQKGRIPYRVASYDYSLLNRAIAMRAPEGFVKLLVSDDEDMQILGMRVLGAHASTSLEVVALMMQEKVSASALAELLHPHPAITEGLQDCVRMLMGTSIYKPQVFQTALRLSRVSYDSDGAVEKS